MKKITKSLSYRNLVKRPARSIALMLLAAFLSFSVFGGTIIVGSLRSGLSSLQDRLGADIMVVPYEAATKSDLENIVLQGNTGYFYMDSSYLKKLAAMEGIGQISAQFYLASASSGCCSIPVQIIGFDPETDFTISPWIKKSYNRPLQDMEIVVGNSLNAFVGDTLTFYGTDVHVAAKLDRTGTSLDTAVYTNENTIKTLIQASLDKKLNNFGDINPDKVISCVLINVAEGYTIEDVLNDINLHVRKVEAVQTKNMISGISGSLKGISDVIGILTAAIWILSLVIMIIAFRMSVNERKKEFAVLRVIGASGKKLFHIVLTEGILVSLSGSLIGIVVGALVILPFGNFIEAQLGLPFLLPGGLKVAGLACISLVASVTAGSFTGALASYKISRMDTGLILREGN
ncbi:MAG: FtsX-like permease family protein [Lachnospiraceae bacterium]|nr:FtsX-like permease family protein [Lachnospiraceae bacterium]